MVVAVVVGLAQQSPTATQGAVGVKLETMHAEAFRFEGAAGFPFEEGLGAFRYHYIEWNRQLPVLLEAVDEVNVFRGQAGVMDGSKPQGIAAGLCGKEGFDALFLTRLGDLEEAFRVVNQDAAGLALGVEEDFAALDAAVAGDAGARQSHAVGDHGMAVNAAEHDGFVCEAFKFVGGGVGSAGPVVLVPAAAANNLGIRVFGDEDLDAFNAFGPGRGAP